MDQNLTAAIRKTMEKKSTDKLKRIYTKHNDSWWSPEAFEAIYQILTERGEIVAPPPPEPLTVQISDTSSAAIPACILGILIGGLVGYLLVPSMPLVGKLPLVHILTRGVFLEGLDTMLVSVAATSFNYILVGAILGGVIGIGLAYLSGAARRESRQKNGGVTRATRVAKLLPEQMVPVEIIGDLPSPGSHYPTVEDQLP